MPFFHCPHSQQVIVSKQDIADSDVCQGLLIHPVLVSDDKYISLLKYYELPR
jgi:hypothetical protein